MSYTRFQRGVRAIGGFASGTSRLARPPRTLLGPAVRPGHICDMTLDFPRILVKLGNPSPAPEGQVFDLAWGGPNGDYLAVAMDASPWLAVYKRDGDTLGNRLTIPSAPSATVRSVDWTPDGQYLAAVFAGGFESNDDIHWWSRSGDTLTRLSDSTGGTSGQNLVWVRWSSSGTYVAGLHDGGSGGRVLQIQKRSGSSLTHLTSASLGAVATTGKFTWAPDTNHLIGGFQSGLSYAFKRSGDTFTSITPPPDLPGNNIGGITWAQDSSVVFLASTDSAPTPDVAYITAHTLTGDTFGSAVNFSVSNENIGRIAMHPSDLALAAFYNVDDAVHILEHSGTTLTDTGTDYPANVPNDFSMRWSDSGVYLAIGNTAGGGTDSTASLDWWKARC